MPSYGTHAVDQPLAPRQAESLEEFVAELERLGPPPRLSLDGRDLIAACPAHEDREPSLSVSTSPGDYLPAVVHCFAGCTGREVYEALGFRYTPVTTLPDGDGGRVHQYHDRDGRWVGSTIKTREGRWRRDPAGAPFPLYNLPAVRAAAARRGEIWLCEGERDADTAGWFAGVVATTAPSHRLTEQHLADLAGARVRIVADNDEAGLRHALEWHKTLTARSIEVTSVKVPRGSKDLSQLAEGLLCDWATDLELAATPGEVEELDPADAGAALEQALAEVDLLEARSVGADPDAEYERVVRQERARLAARESVVAERHEAQAQADFGRLIKGTLTFDDLLNVPDVEYVIEGIAPVGSLVLLAGRPATYKSFLAFDWGCRVASGLDWFGRSARPGRAVFLAAEGHRGRPGLGRAGTLPAGARRSPRPTTGPSGRSRRPLDIGLAPFERSLAVVQVQRARSAEVGGSALEFRVVRAIRGAGAGPVAQARLGERLGVDKSEVSRALKALNSRGLIEPADPPSGAHHNSKWWVAVAEGPASGEHS